MKFKKNVAGFLAKFSISILFISSILSLSYAESLPKILIENPIVIKLSHVVGKDAPKGIASEEFKKIMESKFPGRVYVEVYHDNKLFKDREESEALELGVVNVVLPTSGKIATFYNVKEFELFDLPFLFNKTEDINKFTQSDEGQELLDFFNIKNKKLYAVTYWPNDFRDYVGSKFYKKPDDFKGQTARIQALGTLKLFNDAIGVKDSIVLSFSDLPKAMKKQGEYKVDVSENPSSNTYEAKLYESSKFITLSHHNVNTYVFLTNRRWFNSLPDDIKQGFVAAAKQSGIVHFDIAQKSSATDLVNLKKQGVQTYEWTPQEKLEFKKRAVAVHENYLININKDYLNKVYKTIH